MLVCAEEETIVVIVLRSDSLRTVSIPEDVVILGQDKTMISELTVMIDPQFSPTLTVFSFEVLKLKSASSLYSLYPPVDESKTV